MKIRLLNIQLYLYSECIRFFLKRKKFKTVEYFLVKKRKLAKPMRDNFKIINGREVRTIGYDAEKRFV